MAAPPQLQQPMQAQFQQQILPRPDPVMQAVIEADFRPVDLTLDSTNVTALCTPHSREKCDECDVDYIQLNRLSKVLSANPTLLCPPPPNVVNQKLSQIINQTKEEGNALFRTHQWEKAIGRYTQAAGFATQRAPWEAQQFMREELSTVLSNRSAAYFENGELVAALTDAEAVIQLKKPWSKGHFRKAKALIALGLIPQAKEAVQYGLQFDPTNQEMIGVLQDIELVLRSYANQPRRDDGSSPTENTT
ncbi:hypothetical protein B0F90DRAFT_1695187 [Multifurca ochricompacta]|uniref:Translocation protein sec72 n=1 Tax=Multifurca ochricompacta TaxID=376703 RepID=A0AAD4M8X6_9AGAM|nr:hypothetical protein B0F90DRAFT_1695187 [Multifurca ochricompacta]